MRIEALQRIFCRALVCALLLLPAACGDSEQADTRPATPSDNEAYVDNMAKEHAEDTNTPSGAAALGEVPAMPVLSEIVQYGMVDGAPVTGYLAYPESAHGGLPGVMMFPEWWGLNDNIKAMADKLAGQGYVVLALDVYGGQVADTPQRARELARAAMADAEALNANIRQGWKFMTEEIGALSVASLGWCLGGTLSFNTALLYPDRLAGAVIYYGHVENASRDQLATLAMPVLGLFGAEDSGIPVDGVRNFEQMLNELGKDAEIVVYENAGHAFANPTGQNFRPEAAEDAWRRTLAFLDRTLNAAVNRNVLEQEPAAVSVPASANTR